MRLFLTTAVLALLPFHVHAQEMPNILTLPEGQALLHISATEQQDVAQDMLVASLRYELQNREAAPVQDEINKVMKAALELAAQYSEVKTETTQYSIYKTTLPRTEEQVWQGSQGLSLKSENAERLLALAGELQKAGFVTSGLSYTISPAKAAQVQDAMMEAALAKLQTRAQRAAAALGKSGTALIEVDVQGNYMPSPVAMYRGGAEMMAMKSDMAPPVAAAGEETLSLTVSAKALLKP